MAALAVACLVLGGSAAHAEFRVLAIGNSYVQGNATARDVTLDLQGFFDADATLSGTVVKQAVSAWSLKTHAEYLPTTELITNTAAYQWDAIILQEQSNRPGRAIKFGGSQLTNLDAGGPVLIDLIEQYQPSASVVLFNTWAKFPGHGDLVDYFDNDADQMLAYTNAGYDRIRLNPGGWDHTASTTIARVGDAWDQWYATHGYGNATTRLHLADGTHQNDLGSYLAAAVLFETLTGVSTQGSSFAGAVGGEVQGIPLATLLQHQAGAVTGVTPAPDADFNADGRVDGGDFLIWQRTLGQTGSAGGAWGDANFDAIVDAADLAAWQSQFGAAAAPNASATPEPGAIALATIAAVVLGSRRRGLRRSLRRKGTITQ